MSKLMVATAVHQFRQVELADFLRDKREQLLNEYVKRFENEQELNEYVRLTEEIRHEFEERRQKEGL